MTLVLIIATLASLLLVIGLLVRHNQNMKEILALQEEVCYAQHQLDVYVEAAETNYKELQELLVFTNERLAAAREQNEELELHFSEVLKLNAQLAHELDKLQSRELPQLPEMLEVSSHG